MNYEFMKNINTDNVKLLYTQVLNGWRVQKHDVTYIFDEVGCGKTISAIIAMAGIIAKNEKYKILVLTPKSICTQFTDEIRDKLNIEVENVMNIAFLYDKELEGAIKKIKDSETKIVVSNPHKVEKLVEKIVEQPWDLIIIDEAHDIICNSWIQTSNYYNYEKYDRRTGKYTISNRIDEEYNKFQKQFENEELEEKIKGCFKERIELVESYEKENQPIAQFAKSIVIEEYNRYIGHKVIKIVEERRDNKNALFSAVCKLKSKKVMFLSATPYKYDKDFDFINYALAGTKITQVVGILHPNNLPQLDWVSDIYTLNSIKDKDKNLEKLKKMEEANTSLMFKEIAQAIPLSNCNATMDEKKEEDGKERIVEVWDEGSEVNESFLHNKLFGEDGILKDKQNRVIIFVSNSNEGKYIFKKVFPQAQQDIISGEHKYIDTCGNRIITCEFVMNKFGNASNLKNYAKETKGDSNIIPDILIVTWQVAQVGVNLPTYNYVINYHIPAVPGYLEQRYGRIDRLNSEKKKLYNIYYLDNNPSAQVYRANLIQALWHYKSGIMDIPHNLPVKNLLICKNLSFNKIDGSNLYKSLAYYLFSFIKLDFENLNESDRELKVNEYLKKLLNENLNSSSKNGLCINYSNEKVTIKTANEEYSSSPESFQLDDEINQNAVENRKDEKIDISNVKKQVEGLCNYIENIANMNKMIEELNSGKIGDAGSIIFWNNSNNQVVVKCDDIVKSIVEQMNIDC